MENPAPDRAHWRRFLFALSLASAVADRASGRMAASSRSGLERQPIFARMRDAVGHCLHCKLLLFGTSVHPARSPDRRLLQTQDIEALGTTMRRVLTIIVAAAFGALVF